MQRIGHRVTNWTERKLEGEREGERKREREREEEG
jgi:hypothetical protein